MRGRGLANRMPGSQSATCLGSTGARSPPSWTSSSRGSPSPPLRCRPGWAMPSAPSQASVAAPAQEAVAPNSIVNFFQQVWQRDDAWVKQLLCKPRSDIPFYWEKRRLQNALRRALEALQERFGIDEATASHDEAEAAFLRVANELAAVLCLSSDSKCTFDEQRFCSAMDLLRLWPPELSATDKSEIFVFLCIPSSSTARTALLQKSADIVLSKAGFFGGFSLTPFNVPDFPVPKHLLATRLGELEEFTEQQIQMVAEAVAITWCYAENSLDKIRDPFASGLVSLEEVQTSLPLTHEGLMPLPVVQQATHLVIRQGASHFSAEEWQDLVVAIREAPVADSNKDLDAELPSLATPRGVQAPELENPQAENPSAENPSTSCSQPVEVERQASGILAPRTSPLPCRVLWDDQPVSFSTSAAKVVPPEIPKGAEQESPAIQDGPNQVVNWATVSRAKDPSRSPGYGRHQADESAGGRSTWGTREFQASAAAMRKRRAATTHTAGVPANVDPLLWMNMDLHHECGGPYLGHALVRCCQLYVTHNMREKLPF